MAAHFPAVTPAKAGVQDKRRDLPQRLSPFPLAGEREEGRRLLHAIPESRGYGLRVRT
jgi:hypothetical protein